MATITGNLKLITNNYARTTEVWVRATETRPDGRDVVVGDHDRIQVNNGAVSFAATGAGELVLVRDGRPVECIPFFAGSAASYTLGAVVGAAKVLDVEKTELEKLADEMSAALSQAQQAASDAASTVAGKADRSWVTSELSKKANTSHTHSIANVTGLQAALDSNKSNTVTVETEQEAAALTGLRKGDKVFVTSTGNIYKEV